MGHISIFLFHRPFRVAGVKLVGRASLGPRPLFAIRLMQAAETQPATGFLGQSLTPELTIFNSSKSKNGISDLPIRGVLQSIADLRRYLLVEHPALLAAAAPSLVTAESSIFSILDNIQGK